MSTSRSRAECVAAIEALGGIAIIRLASPERLRAVVEALSAGEVRAIEVTMTMPGALEQMAALRSSLGDAILLGAGTVLDAETARLSILAGARFVVAPTFSPRVVELCHRYGVVAVPGAYTPTEILTAWEAGADLVKVFPARGLGPGYLSELRGPLPQVRLVATGGVTIESAGSFLSAGAVAVGIGGSLVPNEAVANGDYAVITERARALTRAIRAARERA